MLSRLVHVTRCELKGDCNLWTSGITTVQALVEKYTVETGPSVRGSFEKQSLECSNRVHSGGLTFPKWNMRWQLGQSAIALSTVSSPPAERSVR